MWKLRLEDQGDHYDIYFENDNGISLCVGCLYYTQEDSAFNKRQAKQISEKLLGLFNKLEQSASDNIDDFFRVKGSSQSLSVRVPNETYKKLLKFCRQTGLTRTEGLRQLLELALENCGMINGGKL